MGVVVLNILIFGKNRVPAAQFARVFPTCFVDYKTIKTKFTPKLTMSK